MPDSIRGFGSTSSRFGAVRTRFGSALAKENGDSGKYLVWETFYEKPKVLGKGFSFNDNTRAKHHSKKQTTFGVAKRETGGTTTLTKSLMEDMPNYSYYKHAEERDQTSWTKPSADLKFSQREGRKGHWAKADRRVWDTILPPVGTYAVDGPEIKLSKITTGIIPKTQTKAAFNTTAGMKTLQNNALCFTHSNTAETATRSDPQPSMATYYPQHGNTLIPEYQP